MSMARMLGLAALFCGAMMGRVVCADIYLVGAQEYRANSDGSANGDFQYSTNSTTAPFPLSVNNGMTTQSSAISFLLADGLNSFTATNPFGGFSIMGLNLFFSTTAASHNPASNAELSPNSLTVVGAATVPSSMATPVIGTSILSFAANGSNGLTTPANGLTTLSLDGKLISIQTFSFGFGTQGTFQVNVSAVPEASSFALMAMLAGAGFAWRRVRRLPPVRGNLTTDYTDFTDGRRD